MAFGFVGWFFSNTKDKHVCKRLIYSLDQSEILSGDLILQPGYAQLLPHWATEPSLKMIVFLHMDYKHFKELDRALTALTAEGLHCLLNTTAHKQGIWN